MANRAPSGIAANVDRESNDSQSRTRLNAAGGILGALAASSCCILPLVLFSLGVSGAWIGRLTTLAPYKPLFATGTLGLLGYGFYLIYLKQKQVCVDGSCSKPLPSVVVKVSLWTATVLVIAALTFDWIAPLMLK